MINTQQLREARLMSYSKRFIYVKDSLRLLALAATRSLAMEGKRGGPWKLCPFPLASYEGKPVACQTHLTLFKYSKQRTLIPEAKTERC